MRSQIPTGEICKKHGLSLCSLEQLQSCEAGGGGVVIFDGMGVGGGVFFVITCDELMVLNK